MNKIPRSKFNCVGSLIEAAKELGISIEVIDKDNQLMLFSKNGKKYYIKDHVADINSLMSSILTRSKSLTKKLLQKEGFPVPDGIKETNLERALRLLKQGVIKFPLVVKPVDGSQGGAVTANIRSEEWFIKAINEVYKYNRRKKGRPNSFLIEEYVPGNDFRFLVLDGKVLTVLMRKPAFVVGDGLNSIGKLIDEYNRQPGVSKDQPLCPIIRDYELERNLQIQKISEKTILKKGEVVYLRQNANVSTGGRSFECFEKVNSKYFGLMSKISKIFGIRFCSIDIISKDIGKYENFKVIEVNDTPGFDIHEVPYRGRPFPVAKQLLKKLF